MMTAALRALVVLASTALATGCVSDERLSVEEGVGVELVNFAFQPDDVEVRAGQPVEWLNRDAVHHTVTADEGAFSSGTLDSEARFTHVFEEPGEYPYHCEIHPEMHGTVRVVE